MGIWKPKNSGDVLAERIKAIESELKLQILQLEQRFDKEIEQVENYLLDRIDDLEKSSPNRSLTTDKGKASEAAGTVTEGYKPWSQRKAERASSTADPGFAQRVSRRGRQRAESVPEAT